ncbi:CTLH/CRA C-terminal to lish motif domain-containing protein [Gilbertella persicaria]|uniref:CTLH/CRA C-terminal to lish motif domain-containing protein n=1 Tax=Gilbertella persicaria TaxID=101096 RepID=UPI002220EB35|nr:CTLH/CRA C-terminal to lish motif domain-containing protein [Gilbertella persicaria]KAI8048038.1 CTLH/CRA C-terminal to lish motif domain-containing protein [Gilbertella persicaria]
MNTILNSCQDMQKKQINMQDTMLDRLASFRQLLDAKKKELDQGYSPHQTMMQLQEQAKQLQFQKLQKEFQSSLSKLNKDMERKFKQDISVIYHPEAFAGKHDVMYRAIALHFIRQGQFELCDAFMNESEIPVDDPLRETVEQLKHEFEQMYTVLNKIDKEQDLSAAISWAEAHQEGLIKLGSGLGFNLHRMKFIQLLLSTDAMTAIQYGQQHFHVFGDKHYSDIKRLMTAPLYIHDLSNSRYADLCSPSNWIQIKQEFQHDFCSLLKMSAESPLYTAVFVGTTALPVIMKLYTIMSSKKTEWSAQDELPVEVPLDEDLRYHSVFACPVSKEQATDDNPPMMMPCGHVVCKESLLRLSRSSRASSRFKCPYCPSESSVDQAIQVYF